MVRVYNKKNKDKGKVGKVGSKAKEKAASEPAKRGKQPSKGEMIKMQQADGKQYNKKGVKSIDELLGESVRKYDTHDIKEYEAKLNRMNTSDLQRHAISVQVLPKENRTLLIKLLLKQFQINNSGYVKSPPAVGTEKPISQAVIDILAEGR